MIKLCDPLAVIYGPHLSILRCSLLHDKALYKFMLLYCFATTVIIILIAMTKIANS